jgi:hypothetical protein
MFNARAGMHVCIYVYAFKCTYLSMYICTCIYMTPQRTVPLYVQPWIMALGVCILYLPMLACSLAWMNKNNFSYCGMILSQQTILFSKTKTQQRVMNQTLGNVCLYEPHARAHVYVYVCLHGRMCKRACAIYYLVCMHVCMCVCTHILREAYTSFERNRRGKYPAPNCFFGLLSCHFVTYVCVV